MYQFDFLKKIVTYLFLLFGFVPVKYVVFSIEIVQHICIKFKLKCLHTIRLKIHDLKQSLMGNFLYLTVSENILSFRTFQTNKDLLLKCSRSTVKTIHHWTAWHQAVKTQTALENLLCFTVLLRTTLCYICTKYMMHSIFNDEKG